MLHTRLALAFAVCLFSVNWTVRDLGTLPGGGGSAATSISNSGVVVGFAINAAGQQRAVIFNDPVEEIPTAAGFPGSIANSVNDAGQIAGQANEGFLLPIGGSLQSFGPRTGAYAVNEYGDVAGYGTIGVYGSVKHAYVWPGGTTTPLYLGHLGTGLSSAATGISEYPLVCGWSDYDEELPATAHAFLWAEGEMLDLGTLPGGRRSSADALMVESWPDYTFSGTWVVGHSEAAGGVWRAFLWNAGAMTDLGVLPGHIDSRALDVNRSRVAVGYSGIHGSVQLAVMWDGGVIYDLNDLLPPESEWKLTSASGINDRGQIVGAGTYKGELRAFLLEP